MASTEERIRQLVADNLEVDGKPLSSSLDLGVSLTEAGVSSMDVVAFTKVVAQEFNIEFSREQCPTINNLQELIEFLDSQAA